MEATKMSINKRMDKDVVYIHFGILHSHKKNEIMPFAVTWRDLESIILSQSKINICHLYVEPKKYNKQVDIIKKKQAHREQTSHYQWGQGRGGAR